MVVAVTLGLLVWAVADVLLLVFAGVLFAVFLRGVSNAVSQLPGLNKGWSLALVLMLLATGLVMGTLSLGTEVANQLDQLGPRVQAAWQQTLERLDEHPWIRDLFTNAATPEATDWVARATGVFSTTLGAIVSVFIIVFIGLYAAATPNTYRDGLVRLVPLRGRARAREVLDALGTTLRWWLVGTFAKMTMVGTATTVGLLLLDMPLALGLGVLAFLLDFIPYLGPILAAIPALLVALAVGPAEAAWVALLYLVVQSVESYVVAPLVDQRSVHLPPALAISAQLLLGAMLGVLGVALATPLVAAGMVLVRMLYIEDRLGDRAEAAPPRPP